MPNRKRNNLEQKWNNLEQNGTKWNKNMDSNINNTVLVAKEVLQNINIVNHFLRVVVQNELCYLKNDQYVILFVNL